MIKSGFVTIIFMNIVSKLKMTNVTKNTNYLQNKCLLHTKLIKVSSKTLNMAHMIRVM